jgi:hypothetical protein
MMQFIVPTMADGCRSKTELSQVFGISATLSFFSNLLGILLALFFGQDQPDSANIGSTTMVVPVKPTQPRGRQRYLAYCSVCGDPFHPSILSCGVTNWRGTHGCCLRRSCPRGGTRLENPHGILLSIPPAFGALVLSDFNVIANTPEFLQF